jgi:hypothetical protein
MYRMNPAVIRSYTPRWDAGHRETATAGRRSPTGRRPPTCPRRSPCPRRPAVTASSAGVSVDHPARATHRLLLQGQELRIRAHVPLSVVVVQAVQVDHRQAQGLTSWRATNVFPLPRSRLRRSGAHLDPTGGHPLNTLAHPARARALRRLGFSQLCRETKLDTYRGDRSRPLRSTAWPVVFHPSRAISVPLRQACRPAAV